jgi:predicted phage-related endonuclease
LPGTPEHAAVISPSKVASICSVSRWHSAYQLWHEMRGLVPPEPGKDIFDVGKAFELALAEFWKIQHPGWKLSRGEIQYHTTAFGFPALATIDRRATRGRAQHVVEFKIARDTEEWGDPSLDGDCPADYALQVIAQQAITGLTAPAHLMVMGPFFKYRLYQVSFDAVVANWMLDCCRKFWRSLASDTPPDLDDSVSTYTCVRQLHPDIDRGSEANVPASLVADLREARFALKEAERQHRGFATKMLDGMGNAQYAVAEGQRVADRRPHPRGGVSLVLR